MPLKVITERMLLHIVLAIRITLFWDVTSLAAVTSHLFIRPHLSKKTSHTFSTGKCFTLGDT